MLARDEAIFETHWDAIVVGSGIGGATAAYELLQSNKKVLLLEKGPGAGVGNAGLPLWQEPVYDVHSKRVFRPFLGEGVGGSSRLYGMVMERLEESDFQQKGGRWPLSLKEWDPYFSKAETLFQVKAAPVVSSFDPLLKNLSSQKLAPKALKLAFVGNPNCNFCQSRLCESSCKIDAWSGPLQKIVNHANFSLLAEAQVQKVLTQSGSAVAVEVLVKQQLKVIKADKFYLGLGALRTPYLLKNSGIGNSADLLGRYLMRHFVDLYFLKWNGSSQVSHHKSIGINDFYSEMGIFQSFGALPPMEYVMAELLEGAPWVKHIPGAKLVIEKVVKKLFANHVMASIIEDSPEFTNRLIFNDDQQVRFEYKISKENQQKIDRSREIGRKIFSPFLKKVQYEAENNKRLAHVCGTCIMGESVKDSVVDWNGRLHELENLYIVDSSVFPSSTGKNPSLTIAANALRVTQKSLGL
jgi:choline dehydrogenase-like flavoprotein